MNGRLNVKEGRADEVKRVIGQIDRWADDVCFSHCPVLCPDSDWVLMICRHCRVLQRAISVNPAHGRETEQITGSQPIKARQGDGALFFSQPGTHLRSGSFVRSAPFRFLCSSLVHCELRCGGGGGGQNDALCTPSVRPSAFVRSFSLLRLPSSLLTALASSFPPPPPS